MREFFTSLFKSSVRKDLEEQVAALKTELEASQAYGAVIVDENVRLVKKMADARIELQDVLKDMRELDLVIKEVRGLKDFLVMDQDGETVSLQSLVASNPSPNITLFVGSRKGSHWQWKPAQVVSEIAGELMLGDAATVKARNSRPTKKTKRKTNGTGPK